MDFAKLGFLVDSRTVVNSEQDLRRMTRASLDADRGAVKFGKSATKSFKSVALAVGVVVSALASLGGIARINREFGSSMSKVQAITRATATDMRALTAVAKDLGSTTEFSASQAAGGLQFLGMAGFTAKESVEALPAVLDLATASSMGLAAAADTASNIMSAFSIAAKNSAKVADVLAAASSRANTDVSQMGSAMAMVGPVAAALKISMSDSAAAIGVLSDAGIQGGSAGTGLRRVLTALTNATPQATAVIRSMGLTLADVSPEAHSLTEIIDLLAQKGLSASQAMQIFGDRGGPAILALVSQNDRLKELTEELGNVDGEAKRMADTMRDNLEGDVKSLWSAIEGLAIAIGEAGLTAVLRAVVGTITSVVRGISSAITIVDDWTTNLVTNRDVLMEQQRAIDNVTTATGDEIAAINTIASLIEGATVMSRRQAEAKLKEAEAIYVTIEARRREQVELVKQGGNYQSSLTITKALNYEYTELLAMKREQGTLDEYQAAVMKDIVSALSDERQYRDDILAFSVDLNDETEKGRDLIQTIRDALDASSGKWVDLNGEAATSVTLSERLRVILEGIAGPLDAGGSSASNLSGLLAGAARAALFLGNSLSFALGKLNSILSGLPGVGAGFGALGNMVSGIGGSDAFAGLGTTLRNAGSVVALKWAAVRRQVNAPGYGETAGGGGGGAEQEDPFFQDSSEQVEKLKLQIEMIGKTRREIIELTAKHKLLTEAKRRGLDLDQTQIETGNTLRQDIDAQAESIANLTLKYEKAKERADFFNNAQGELKDGLLDAIIEGENFAGVLASIAKKFARAALEAALFNSGPFASGGTGGGGLLSNIFGGGGGFMKLLGFSGGGYTGSGSRTGGLDGEGGKIALLHPQETVTDHYKGQSVEGGTSVVRVELGEGLVGSILKIAGGQSVQISQETAQQQQAGLGVSMGSFDERGIS